MDGDDTSSKPMAEVSWYVDDLRAHRRGMVENLTNDEIADALAEIEYDIQLAMIEAGWRVIDEHFNDVLRGGGE